MYQEGDMVSDDEDGGSDEFSTPYASAHSSPARQQSSPEEEEADNDDELLVDQRDTLLYGEVRASVPFNWEESPGKPKLKFSERNHNNSLQIAAAAANGLPQPTRRLSTEEYVGRGAPALQASPDQLQHLLPTPGRLLPLPPRLKAVKSNLLLDQQTIIIINFFSSMELMRRNGCNNNNKAIIVMSIIIPSSSICHLQEATLVVFNLFLKNPFLPSGLQLRSLVMV
jgi:hypothetical protein